VAKKKKKEKEKEKVLDAQLPWLSLSESHLWMGLSFFTPINLFSTHLSGIVIPLLTWTRTRHTQNCYQCHCLLGLPVNTAI
jgi:hypothetical protein